MLKSIIHLYAKIMFVHSPSFSLRDNEMEVGAKQDRIENSFNEKGICRGNGWKLRESEREESFQLKQYDYVNGSWQF